LPTYLPQLITAGLAVGAIYGLLATGFIVIYRATGVVNFAQGDMATVGAFTALWALRTWHVPVVMAYAFAIGVMALIGILLFRVVYVPLRTRSVVIVSIGTLGLALAMRGLLLVIFGPQPAGLPSPVGDQSISYGGVVVSAQSVLVVGVTAVLIGIQAILFNRTSIGHALRAIAEDQEMARVLGIRVERLLLGAFAYGAALAALAGVLLAPTLSVSLDLGWSVAFASFIAAIVGGLGSLSGAATGGLIIGMVQVLGQFYVSGPFGTSLVFGVLLVILLLRPNGIFKMVTSQRLT
jgi:branched-chain amino acid transport system permease protein